MTRPNILLLSLLVISTVSVIALAQDCRYTISVKTADRKDAGTDAVIGVILADQSGEYIEIPNLETWGGTMAPGHDYFERGNLDIFSEKERCLPSPVCFLTLHSDNTGGKPGWYVAYVDVMTAKPGSPGKLQHFGIQQWLALSEAPYQLSTNRNNCPQRVESEIQKSLFSIV